MSDKLEFESMILGYAMKNKERNIWRRMLIQNRFEQRLLAEKRGAKHPWIMKLPVKAMALLGVLCLPFTVLMSDLIVLRLIKALRRKGIM